MLPSGAGLWLSMHERAGRRHPSFSFDGRRLLRDGLERAHGWQALGGSGKFEADDEDVEGLEGIVVPPCGPGYGAYGDGRRETIRRKVTNQRSLTQL